MAEGGMIDAEKVRKLLTLACSTEFGMVDSQFLCKSVGTLDLREPTTMRESSSIVEVMRVLKANNMGCVLVVDDKQHLSGIFSERDYLTKIFETNMDLTSTPISRVMTPEPFTVTPDSPIAFVLNLMAEGGFRHVPVVDAEGLPLAVVSVRDIVQALVERYTSDLLNVELDPK